tara:strand:+ start:114 stop:908 length:795 start_codon:yes stop_codon:yes gene_type:complete
MSLVAASKMRRAQNSVLEGRPYSEKIQEIISHLAAQRSDDSVDIPSLLQVREVAKVGLLVITPDRGLAGGLHSNVNRAVTPFILSQEVPVETIVVGRKGRDFLVRAGQDVKAVFTDLSDRPSLIDTTPIARLIIEGYSNREVDEVYIAYTQFVSTMSQQAVIEKLLPVEPAALTGPSKAGYIYEPDANSVLDSILPQFVEMQVYHAILEAIASEQSARMVAMRSATDNANGLSQDLTLVMNKIRQDSITNELLDLIGGVIALEG